MQRSITLNDSVYAGSISFGPVLRGDGRIPSERVLQRATKFDEISGGGPSFEMRFLKLGVKAPSEPSLDPHVYLLSTVSLQCIKCAPRDIY